MFLMFRKVLADSLMISGFVFVMMLLVEYLQVFSAGLLGRWLKKGGLFRTAAVALVGIIPESGPHMVFVTLFAQGFLPFSVLAASSVVQDGHGMLPLLAESPKEFLKVKAVTVLAGLALGGGLMILGF